MIQIFEKLFFKKRYILSWNQSNVYNLPHRKGYSINVFRSFNEFDDFISNDTIFLKRNRSFLKMLEHSEWMLFTITEEGKKELAGYYFVLISSNKQVLHDKFIIKPNEALMCHAFIYPQYRNNGLYKTLIKFSHAYLLKENHKNIYTIVEESNTASLKANLDSGLEYYEINYLVKFFGVNLLSMFYQKSKLILIITGKIFQNKKIYQA
ncbi:hypothetical protein SAMN05444280_14414 [Tangfeifania diversioriginum]|uniref:N-acetyltransferase domain-containing protein n=1 Tax=Tangfeifania diversioriginum TaxID=1168035 RepID=A0A1M6NN40_9BACT|nr:hypothetical protein [Tangfeifania diversioriginum]SHJ97159.1 hypothetical protein SAMN05444280_14414 [Tangfeifania diversioriginum]